MSKQSRQQALQTAAHHSQECESICITTIQYCLQSGGKHTEPTHMRLLQDCADSCESSAKYFARGSVYNAGVGNLCAQICDDCAASCDQFVNDPQMKACADACRACAAACRQAAAA
jgi:hypothetical protein